MKDFFQQSMELHLFFARIMKEHALFLQTGFQMINKEQIRKANWFRNQFEDLLRDVVKVSDGMVCDRILKSGEIITEFTFLAERKTSQLTGVPIDSRITRQERKIIGKAHQGCSERQRNRKASQINQRALNLLNGLIAFKEQLYVQVTRCGLFTANYPLLIQHITREAKLYRSFVRMLERKGRICREDMCKTELFWNQIMMEHALFIRGLLDPTEEKLIDTADQFAKEYCHLLEEAEKKNCAVMEETTGRTIEITEKYRDFKEVGTKGIAECQIQSIILPLLADHVLREANHYLRLLKEQKGLAYGSV